MDFVKWIGEMNGMGFDFVLFIIIFIVMRIGVSYLIDMFIIVVFYI